MKIKRLRSVKKGRIEIIPMIDVMFFLLATFMLASLSMQKYQGIAVNLIEGKGDNVKQQEENLTISITHDNKIFLNQKETNLENLSNDLSAQIKDFESIITVASDKNSLQGISMQALLEAKKAGAKHFSLVVKN